MKKNSPNVAGCRDGLVLLPHGSNDNEPLASRPDKDKTPPPWPNDDGPIIARTAPPCPV